MFNQFMRSLDVFVSSLNRRFATLTFHPGKKKKKQMTSEVYCVTFISGVSLTIK